MKFLQGIDENQYWIIMWAIVFTAFILFTLMVSSCEIHSIDKNTELKSELLKKGYSPMDIRCMHTTSEDTVCILYVEKMQKQQQSTVNENEISSGD